MGREIRRVPATWQHPKDERGRYIPLLRRSFAETLAEYERDRAAWERGEFPGYASETSRRRSFVEWAGGPPEQPEYHMPEWPDEERTHWQMYENTSEGTPISPVFATPEECARWCADHGASAFGGETADYEWWLGVAEGFRPRAPKDNPEGYSLLRLAYRSYYFLKRFQEIEAIGCERRAVGIPRRASG